MDHDGFRDLGEHRLKDLSAPERIYQLGDDDFPPLESLHQTNLPIPSTPFLGREQELREVLELLSREDVRLLTLTGPGGTGKTRLAAQAAGISSAHYPHGVWWVPLAPLRDPELVLATAGQALGSKNGLAEHIGDKRLLLLFDNFEHVSRRLPSSPRSSASCPDLDLLVTSREPLHVTGEQEYPVPPFVHEEGVGFFLARARAVEPDFQADDAVAEICRRLDDLPLALELAAARVKALSSAQILERLDAAPAAPDGRRQRPARAPAHPPRDDRVELRAARRRRSSASSPASPSSAAAARSRPRRRSQTPISTSCSRSSTRASLRHTERALLDARDDPRVSRRSASRRTRDAEASGSGVRTRRLALGECLADGEGHRFAGGGARLPSCAARRVGEH